MGGLSSIIIMLETVMYPFRVINGYFGRFFNRILGGRAFSLTLAGRISIAFFFCFALFITTVMLMHLFNTRLYQGIEIEFSGSSGVDFVLNFVLYFLLALLISIVVYWGVRLATREKPSLYPEIDQCWHAFDQWRTKEGLQWHEFNRFLVLGPNLTTSRAMHAEMKDRKVDALPGGSNDWMHWFGSNENLYLHLKKISHTNQRIEKFKTAGPGGISFTPDNTLQASVGVPAWSAEVGLHDATAEVDSFESVGVFGSSLDAANSLDPYDSAGLDGGGSEVDSTASQAEETDHGYEDDDDTPAERVGYLAKLMLAKTEGEVPFHGIVVTIPFDKFIQRENYKSITAAIKRDLMELRSAGDVMFPVSIVFTAMERDQGFPKLQNLLGSQRASSGRFGAGCQIEDLPLIDSHNLDIQVKKSCQAFEDWVVNRWSKSSQLARAAQNKELYKLVIRIRQQFRMRLTHLLSGALIWNPSECPDGETTDLSLAGCYFVSTGEHEAERGFLNGVFMKCHEFAETSSWSESALFRNRIYSLLSSLLFLLSLAVIAAVGFYLYSNQG